MAVVISLFVRRHGESDQPAGRWTPTDELFKDPGTNRTMRVWLDRAGERHYVPEAERLAIRRQGTRPGGNVPMPGSDITVPAFTMPAVHAPELDLPLHVDAGG